MGDAGAIVTNDEDFAKKMAAFARHGGLVKGEHRFEGINSRMDTIQAAILRVKMRYLKEWTDIRRAVASAYTKGIVGSEDFKLPTERDGYYHVWHLFTVRVEDRQGFAEYLDKNNITFAINYPVSLPFLPAYERLNSRATDFPEAYSHQNQLLCLPLFSEMSANQVDRVINVIADYLTKNSRD
jgi:dTDP-4-amino-4,6-dideoxygalactose transaminase